MQSDNDSSQVSSLDLKEISDFNISLQESVSTDNSFQANTQLNTSITNLQANLSKVLKAPVQDNPKHKKKGKKYSRKGFDYSSNSLQRRESYKAHDESPHSVTIDESYNLSETRSSMAPFLNSLGNSSDLLKDAEQENTLVVSNIMDQSTPTLNSSNSKTSISNDNSLKTPNMDEQNKFTTPGTLKKYLLHTAENNESQMVEDDASLTLLSETKSEVSNFENVWGDVTQYDQVNDSEEKFDNAIAADKLFSNDFKVSKDHYVDPRDTIRLSQEFSSYNMNYNNVSEFMDEIPSHINITDTPPFQQTPKHESVISLNTIQAAWKYIPNSMNSEQVATVFENIADQNKAITSKDIVLDEHAPSNSSTEIKDFNQTYADAIKKSKDQTLLPNDKNLPSSLLDLYDTQNVINYSVVSNKESPTVKLGTQTFSMQHLSNVSKKKKQRISVSTPKQSKQTHIHDTDNEDVNSTVIPFNKCIQMNQTVIAKEPLSECPVETSIPQTTPQSSNSPVFQGVQPYFNSDPPLARIDSKLCSPFNQTNTDYHYVSSNSHQSLISSQINSRILVPSYLAFPGTQCVDLRTDIVTEAYNPSNMEVFVSMEFVNFKLNNYPLQQNIPFEISEGFILAAMCTKAITIGFLPLNPGEYTGEVCLTCRARENDVDILYNISIPLRAKADNPDIKFYLNGQEVNSLIAPQLKPGSTSNQMISIINRSNVNLNVLITAKSSIGKSLGIYAADGNVFQNTVYNYSFELSGRVDTESGCTMASKALTLTCVAPGNCKEREIMSSLNVFAVSEFGKKLLSSLHIEIPVHLSKLYIPQHAQHIYFQKTLSQQIPIKNCTKDVLNVTTSSNNSAFVVHPQSIRLEPEIQTHVRVKFLGSSSAVHGSVVFTVEPEGPVYTVNVEALGQSKNNISLLCNCDNLFFPGVEVGQSSVQHCIVRNSSNESFQIAFHIRYNKSRQEKVFQIYEISLPFDQNDDRYNVKVGANEDVKVSIIFNPNKITYYSASLYFQPSGKVLKYSLPLFGYGGRSNVTLSFAQNSTFVVKNIGSRYAFVYLTMKNNPGFPRQISIKPHTELPGFNTNLSVCNDLRVTWCDQIVKAISKSCCVAKNDQIDSEISHFLALKYTDSVENTLPEKIALSSLDLVQCIKIFCFPASLIQGFFKPSSPSFENEPSQENITENIGNFQSWSVEPQQIFLNAVGYPPASLVIVNKLSSPLPFHISQVPDDLSISCCSGIIKKRSQFKILVKSANCNESCLPAKLSIHANDQTKLVDVFFNNSDSHDLFDFTSKCKFSTISTRTLEFPQTKINAISVATLRYDNCFTQRSKWILTSPGPAYVTNHSGTLFRCLYSAFRFVKSSGTCDVGEDIVIQIEFCPLDSGKFNQHLELVLSYEDSRHYLKRHQINVQGVGLLTKSAKELPSKTLEVHSLTATSDAAVVYAKEGHITFEDCIIDRTMKKVLNIKNSDSVSHSINFLPPNPPFFLNHQNYTLSSRHYIQLPVFFRPKEVGNFTGILVVTTDINTSIPVTLTGNCKSC